MHNCGNTRKAGRRRKSGCRKIRIKLVLDHGSRLFTPCATFSSEPLAVNYSNMAVMTRSSTSAKANGTPPSNGKANGYTNGTGSKKQLKKRVSDDDLETTPKRPRLEEKTDITRWRMLDEKGRHTWHYLEDDESVERWPQSYADKWYLGLDTVRAFFVPLKYKS